MPDDALVIRGGKMENLGGLRDAAVDFFDGFGFYGISAWGGIDVEINDLIVAGSVLNGTIAVSTAGRIRQAGFVVELTMGPRHCTIDLGEYPTDDVLWAFRKAFADFVPNPYKVRSA